MSERGRERSKGSGRPAPVETFHPLPDGTQWLELGSCESTQDALWSAPEGVSLVSARAQRQGRGRRGRQWLSPVGGLYLSWRPQLPFGPADGVCLPFLAASALAELLEAQLDLRVQLKWPNDLLVAGAKLAGILVEGRSVGPRWSALVGIGLNAESLGLPPEATSLAALGHPVDPNTLIFPLYEHLQRLLREVSAAPSPLPAALKRWRSFEFPLGTEILREGSLGRYQGVNDEGALIFAGENEQRLISSGEVTLISHDQL